MEKKNMINNDELTNVNGGNLIGKKNPEYLDGETYDGQFKFKCNDHVKINRWKYEGIQFYILHRYKEKGKNKYHCAKVNGSCYCHLEPKEEESKLELISK